MKNTKKKHAVISVSGGMDSTGLLMKMFASKKYRVIHILNFFYGQKHKLEISRLKKNLEYIINSTSAPYPTIIYKKIDLSSIMSIFESALIQKELDIPEGHYEQENMKQTIVPNRNAIFSSIIYGYALSISKKYNVYVDIGLGVHSGDHYIYPDCRPDFYSKLKSAFEIGNIDSNKIKWYIPFMNGNKTSILKSIQKSCNIVGLDFNIILKNTNTCYNPQNQKSCGKCGSCTERLEAFKNINKTDPVNYIKK